MEELFIIAIRMILAHPQGAMIIVGLFTVLGVIDFVNGHMRGKPSTIVGMIVDRLSKTTRADAVGTFKLPGTASKVPPLLNGTVEVVVETKSGESAK